MNQNEMYLGMVISVCVLGFLLQFSGCLKKMDETSTKIRLAQIEQQGKKCEEPTK